MAPSVTEVERVNTLEPATAGRNENDRRSDGGEGSPARLRVRRFDADRTDESLTLEAALEHQPTGRQLLWIDVANDLLPGELDAIVEAFDLNPRTRQALAEAGVRPHVALHGAYIHVRVAVEPDPRRPDRAPWLDLIAGRNVVISRHCEPVSFLEGLDERIETDTAAGLLDSATFAASILDGAVTSYLRTVDAIEDEVDRLDARSLRDDGRRELLEDLVGLRRRISRLRRLLTDHRELFASLAAADFVYAAENEDRGEIAAVFASVGSRFESAIGAVEDAREVLLGSFDVYMTRTAQRTNEVMKVLALATVLLLPGSLIAGLLGMNVAGPLPTDSEVAFWGVVAAVGLLAIGVLVVARLRRWL